MRSYGAIFRLRFVNFLQYRTAAWAGVATQFVWGMAEIVVYSMFYLQEGVELPMRFEALVNYIWLRQAFLSLFALWIVDSDIIESIRNGDVAYELCRPIELYQLWFVKSAASRLSRCILRSVPILFIACFLLPDAYRLTLPNELSQWLLFALSMTLSLLVVSALCMLIYVLSFYALSANGVRLIFSSVADFLCGSIIPLAFFPKPLDTLVYLLPFASVQDISLRIFSGELAGSAAWGMIGVQCFWAVVLIAFGRWLLNKVTAKIVVQGG